MENYNAALLSIAVIGIFILIYAIFDIPINTMLLIYIAYSVTFNEFKDIDKE